MGRRSPPATASAVIAGTVLVPYRGPYEWPAMIAFLRARAIDGVESVVEDAYRRTVLLDGHAGTIDVTHQPDLQGLSAVIRFPEPSALPSIIARIRHVFDVDADVATMGAHLARDPMLAPLVAAKPGLRTPGAWDGFELATRAVLGQQITVEAARRLAAVLVRACGTPTSLEGPTFAFPTAEEVERADLSVLGMPNARRQTLVAIARAAIADPRLFERRETLEETVARLRAIRGIGEWTAQYIALRAAREPDAFPSSDVGLLRGATPRGGVRPSPAELEARAERWRPWRAYAAQHLWSSAASA